MKVSVLYIMLIINVFYINDCVDLKQLTSLYGGKGISQYSKTYKMDTLTRGDFKANAFFNSQYFHVYIYKIIKKYKSIKFNEKDKCFHCLSEWFVCMTLRFYFAKVYSITFSLNIDNQYFILGIILAPLSIHIAKFNN